jgi:hypothetical protein
MAQSPLIRRCHPAPGKKRIKIRQRITHRSVTDPVKGDPLRLPERLEFPGCNPKMLRRTRRTDPSQLSNPTHHVFLSLLFLQSLMSLPMPTTMA